MGIDTERYVVEETFCGIDPGREKFGFAAASSERLLFAAIIPFAELDVVLPCLSSGDTTVLTPWRTEGAPGATPFSKIFLGGGTSHEIYERRLREKDIPCERIDERMTTLEARELYWKLHPQRGLLRFIPQSMRVPPRPIDDLAAWAIIIRALGDMRRIGVS
jgi:RNase H-fold protein (predicted Holliday junction resolvase)